MRFKIGDHVRTTQQLSGVRLDTVSVGSVGKIVAHYGAAEAGVYEVMFGNPPTGFAVFAEQMVKVSSLFIKEDV